MANAQLVRAKKAIQAAKTADRPDAIADLSGAVEELLSVVRDMELRLAAIERKS